MLTRAVLVSAFMVCSSGAFARDLTPDNWSPKKLVYSSGSTTILEPDSAWGADHDNELRWRILSAGGPATSGNIRFMNFQIKVVKNTEKPGKPIFVNVTYFGQSNFPDAAPCKGTGTVRVILRSKAGKEIPPSPMEFASGVDKHEIGPLKTFNFGPIKNYPLSEIATVELVGKPMQADCGD